MTRPSVSIVLAIWGEGYSEFLPQWFKATEELEREFDEIVVVTDNNNASAVLCAITNFSKVRIRVEEHDDYSGYFNRAIDLATSKWIAFCNADDVFLPKALNSLDQADAEEANLICDNLIHKGSNFRQSAYWEPSELNHTFRLMGANPMTKQLWEAAGGFPKGVRFADWGLALRMKKTGLVKPFYAQTDRIVYDVGYDRLTLSGATLSNDDRAEGNQQINKLVEQLEL
jgi:glycosyltransferase involved in cell wall biosynthesis